MGTFKKKRRNNISICMQIKAEGKAAELENVVCANARHANYSTLWRLCNISVTEEMRIKEMLSTKSCLMICMIK